MVTLVIVQDYLDPGHYSLGVFASKSGNFNKAVPQSTAAAAAKQMSSFMRMLMDPARPLTPTAVGPNHVGPPSYSEGALRFCQIHIDCQR